MVSRAIFVLLSALAGMALFIKADGADASYWMYGFAIGGATGGLIVAGEYALRNLSFGIIVGGTEWAKIQGVVRGLRKDNPLASTRRHEGAGLKRSLNRHVQVFPVPKRPAWALKTSGQRWVSLGKRTT